MIEQTIGIVIAALVTGSGAFFLLWGGLKLRAIIVKKLKRLFGRGKTKEKD